MTPAVHHLDYFNYCSYLSNSRGGWNKRGWGAKVAKSINVEVVINVEGGIFWKKPINVEWRVEKI